MWRFIPLAALGFVIGSRARSERRVVVLSLFFGLVYGGVELIFAGDPSLGRAIYFLGLGVVLAAPVYAVAELWRRARVRVIRRLQRLWHR